MLHPEVVPRNHGLRMLDRLRRLCAAVLHAMSSVFDNPETLPSRAGAAEHDDEHRGDHGPDDHEGKWQSDLFSFRPLYDRGAAISLSATADGPLATLARIELNGRSGRDLVHGLDDPDQLNKPGSP